VPLDLRPQYVRIDPDGKVLFEYAADPDPAMLISSLRRQSTNMGRYVAARLLSDVAVEASMLIGIRPILSRRYSPLVDRILLGVVSRLAPSTAALRDLLSVVNDSTSRVRPVAVKALGEFGGSTDARRAALDAANTSGDPLVLAAAVEALVRSDSTLAWRVLQSAAVTESRGNIVRRTAANLIPAAGVNADIKVPALLSLVTDSADERLHTAAARSLLPYSDDETVRITLLAMWPEAGLSMREAILDVVTGNDPNEDEAAQISAWRDAEPDTAIRRRLEIILSAMDR
jgi:hypothetical protein